MDVDPCFIALGTTSDHDSSYHNLIAYSACVSRPHKYTWHILHRMWPRKLPLITQRRPIHMALQWRQSWRLQGDRARANPPHINFSKNKDSLYATTISTRCLTP